MTEYQTLRVRSREPVVLAKEFAAPMPETESALRNVALEDATGALLASHVELPRQEDRALATGVRRFLAGYGGFGTTGRLSGIENDAFTFGYAPASPMRQRFGCGPSRFDADQPTAASALHALAAAAWRFTAEQHPEVADEQRRLVAEIQPDWRLRSGVTMTPWTSGVVNRSASLPYHRDSGNVAGSWSAMITLRQGMEGGELHLPDLDQYLACDDLSLTVFNGQGTMHGVTPIHRTEGAGHRFSIVFYAKSAFLTAQSPKDEQRRAALRATDSFQTPRDSQ